FLLVRQELVDEAAEDLHGLGAANGRALDTVARFRPRYHEPRRALDPGGQTVFEALLDSPGVLARRQAGVERGAIEPERTCVLAELRRGKGLLVLEESVVHLPILALVASTVGGLGGLARLRMDLIERVVPKHIRSEERRVGKECRCQWAPDQ